MKIGSVNLENNIFLAPMAGVTDMPFRILCREQGCGLVYSEMISAKGMFYKDEKSWKLADLSEAEKPAAVQIFGSEPEILAHSAEKLNASDAAILDINMGCPTPKITKNGEGSALMLKPELAGEIIRAVVSVSQKPVTVKIRKGWDDEHLNAVEIAQLAEKNGAAAIAVHGRTREQFYSGKADWGIIKSVKESVSIPVIGNGDIYKPEDAARMLELTGCDALMVGRGAQGNPWIFNRIRHYLKTGEILPEPSIEVKKETILRICICWFRSKVSTPAYVRCESILPGISRGIDILHSLKTGYLKRFRRTKWLNWFMNCSESSLHYICFILE